MLDDSYRGHNLVFVVGCPRSGTTWVQRLLAAHPRVRTGQESDVFDLYVGPQLRTWRRELDADTSGRSGIGLACYLREDEFMAVLRRYLLAMLEPMVGGLGVDEIFVEKTPSHAVFIDEIHELLPEARFVHVLRDARDVVASLLAAHRSWGSRWAPGDPAEAARMWTLHVAEARSSLDGLPSGLGLEVRYEDLAADAATQLERVARHLGLDWSAAEREQAVAANAVSASLSGGGTEISVGGEVAARSGAVVAEPSGFVRKGRVGAWREDLTTREKLAVWRVARDAMAEHGYPWRLPL